MEESSISIDSKDSVDSVVSKYSIDSKNIVESNDLSVDSADSENS